MMFARLFAVGLCMSLWVPAAQARDLIVFAAASLKGPLDEIAAEHGGVRVSYAGSGTLARQVAQGAIAMGFTASVPAGIYGKAAFETLGVWDAIAPLVVEMDSVRAALTLVARGEVPLGVVYASDAQVVPELSIVATFPPESHPLITYAGAVTTSSVHPEAAAFLEALRGSVGQAVFAAAGFCGLPATCAAS